MMSKRSKVLVTRTCKDQDNEKENNEGWGKAIDVVRVVAHWNAR
jgi:hypothetical protein